MIPTASSVQSAIQNLGPWFHNLHLPDGTQTAPAHRLGDFPSLNWRLIAPHIPEDLTGQTVLDIGCNAGFYAIELARRGAQVLAVDHDPRYLKQAQWAAEQFELAHRIRFAQMDVYELPALGDRTFDIVWFMGVFYHLRYPLLGLDLVRQHVGRLLVFQSLTMPGGEGATMDTPTDCDIKDRRHMLDERYPKMAFIEHRLAGDPTNWWAPNEACVEAMLRSCRLRVIARPGHEAVIAEHIAQGSDIATELQLPEIAAAAAEKARSCFSVMSSERK